MSQVLTGVSGWFKRQFQKPEGKDFLSADTSPIDIEKTGKIAGIGAGVGAATGALGGFIKARMEISKVPHQTVSHDYRVPMTQREELGLIPRDSYQATPGWSRGFSLSWNYPHSDNGVPTESVYRDNPVYGSGGSPRFAQTSETFTGRGEPTTTWQDVPVKHYTMTGYDRSVTPDIEQVYDHTRYWTEQEAYTVYDSETRSYQDCVSSYNSDGSTGQDCTTQYETVQVPRTEYRTVERSEDVYRDELRGYYERYSPDISSRTVGTYKVPKVSFDHGVKTAGYVLKGMLIGAGLGALAAGVGSVIQQRLAERKEPTTPDPKPVPTPPRPTPPAPEPPKPSPPPEPKPYYGDVTTHAHDGVRHTHAGGDRWHYHGCPDDGGDPLDTSVICFKPGQVPSGYKDETPTDCSSNGSVCFIQKGNGAS